MQPANVALDGAARARRARSARRSCSRVGELDPKSKADELRREEARTIAALLHTAHRERWEIRDRHDDGRWRPCRWGDMAILMPARTGIEHYEDALAGAGIPYRHEGSRDFYQRQEVRDLIWVLAAIDDPTDRLALVGALRSSAFAIDDEESRAPPRRGGLAVLPLHDARARRGGQRRARRAGQPAPDAHAALARRDRPPRGRAHPAGRVRAHPPRRRPGRREPARDRRPGAAVRRRRRGRAEAVHPPPARLDGRGADRDRGDRRRGDRRRRADHDRSTAPRASSIRSSRSPTSAARNPNHAQPVPREQERFLHFRVGAGSAGRHGHFKTPGYDDAWEQEKQYVEAERLRLLYVAATRAREHLIVPCVAGILGASGLLASLAHNLPKRPTSSSTRFGSTSSSSIRRRGRSSRSRSPAKDIDRGLAEREAWLADLEALKRLARKPREIEIASSRERPRGPLAAEVATFDAALVIGQGPPIPIGDAVHMVMERVTLPGARGPRADRRRRLQGGRDHRRHSPT